MTKKHFIELADMMRALQPAFDPEWVETVAYTSEPKAPTGAFKDADRELRYVGQLDQWQNTVLAIADFCSDQNPQFNQERWLAYIAGECGPGGGKKR